MVICAPDVKQITFDSTCEFMVIACDGIWDCVDNQTCIDRLRDRLINNRYKRLSELIEELFDGILSKTKEEVGNDNMTCILIKFKQN